MIENNDLVLGADIIQNVPSLSSKDKYEPRRHKEHEEKQEKKGFIAGEDRGFLRQQFKTVG